MAKSELCIDTSTRWAGVAIDEAEIVWRSRQNHSRELLPKVHEVMAKVDKTVGDIGRIVVATGPGGFSAIRTGLATALRLAMPRDLPVVGVSTFALEVASADLMGRDKPLMVVIPFGSKQLSWAFFGKPSLGSLREPDEQGAGDYDSVRAIATSKGALICGEGTEILSPDVAPYAGRKPSMLAWLARNGCDEQPLPRYTYVANLDSR